MFNRRTILYLKFQKISFVKDVLKKFTSDQYRPLTEMYRISFKRSYSKSITSTYTIFDVKVY